MENNFARPYVPWKDYTSKVNARPTQNKTQSLQKKEDFVIPAPNSFAVPRGATDQKSTTQMKSRIIKFSDSFEHIENESELRLNSKSPKASLQSIEKASDIRKKSSNSRNSISDKQNNPLRPEKNHHDSGLPKGKSSRPNSNNHYGYKPDYVPRSAQDLIPAGKNKNQASGVIPEYLNEMIDTAAPYRNKKLSKDLSKDKVQNYYQQGGNKDYQPYSNKPFRQVSPANQNAQKINIGLLDQMFEQHEKISSNNNKKSSVGFEERKTELNYKRNKGREEYWPDEEEVLRIAMEKQIREEAKASSKDKKENIPKSEDVWVKCSYCDSSVPIDVLSVHEQECDNKKIPCEKCGKRILMEIYDFHVNSECKKRHSHRHRSHNSHYHPSGYHHYDVYDPMSIAIMENHRANRNTNGDNLGTYEELLALDDNKVKVGMSKSELDKFETKTFRVNDGGPKECNVCLTEFENGDQLRKLKCKHEFHQDCIDRWLKDNITCPMCKTYTK